MTITLTQLDNIVRIGDKEYIELLCICFAHLKFRKCHKNSILYSEYRGMRRSSAKYFTSFATSMSLTFRKHVKTLDMGPYGAIAELEHWCYDQILITVILTEIERFYDKLG